MTAAQHSLPLKQVQITDAFWAPRLETNRTATLPIEYEQCKKTGRLDALKLQWKPGMPNEPHIFWESDVAKWVEAAAYSLETTPDPVLADLLDEVVNLLAGAQQPDGYLNTHFTVVEPERRWANLQECHELYCAGHLMEAAVAHFHATGSRKLLDVMCRFADLIDRTFGSEPGKKRGYCGHPEIELALVKLARTAGEPRYLKLAEFFVNERGQEPNYFRLEEEELKRNGWRPSGCYRGHYEGCQAHKPVREQDKVTGHAVRAMYLYSGMADVAETTGDPTLVAALHKLWNHLHTKQLYVTGGIGSSRAGEAFSFDYDLPNEVAYCETCAAIALLFWNHRMLQLEGEGKYADEMERSLYNNILAGVSLDGRRFFYANPLAAFPEESKDNQEHMATTRQEWFGCACCPPNIARLLASFGQYIYSESDLGLAVHLYVASDATFMAQTTRVVMRQQTAYPWKGKARFIVRPEQPVEFTLALRIPGWSTGATIKVNGAAATPVMEKGYALLKRRWRNGDKVELNLPMPVERIEANPKARMDCGRVALQRGPVVYCLEETDNGRDLNDLALPHRAKLKAVFAPELLGGVVTITGTARRRDPAAWNDGRLYQAAPTPRLQVPFKAVPYGVWNNRGPGEMIVWMRVE